MFYYSGSDGLFNNKKILAIHIIMKYYHSTPRTYAKVTETILISNILLTIQTYHEDFL